MMRYLPFAVFIIIGIGLAVGLTLNPREIPSALIGKPVPQFALPALEGRDQTPEQGFADTDLKAGQPALVNVFASWCLPCRVEHPLLVKLQRAGTVIHGINYKDEPAAAARWLLDLGDPFARVGADREGRVSIDWGVYGVPETFVVDGKGQIICKHVGALTDFDVQNKIRPALDAAKAGRAVPSEAKC